MDPGLYNTRRGGLSELIDSLEEGDVQSGNIYITPPEDGVDTDIESDLSDDDHICHSGPAMLRTESEYVPVQHEDSEMPVQEYDSEDDNIPLATSFPNAAAHLLSEEVLTNLQEQSNLYAQQKNYNLNLTRNQLLVVIGGLLLSGYGKYPNKRMYWSNENDVPKILSESIRLNRFETILRHVHLNDYRSY
ncbi:hypothetical protein JTB14_016669 [Gonioctena quinquepunctata]|nr:hypothetical protein JTB14_016669 [Gonioctena quinquepunctata]